jgi:hypothetical protein
MTRSKSLATFDRTRPGTIIPRQKEEKNHYKLEELITRPRTKDIVLKYLQHNKELYAKQISIREKIPYCTISGLMRQMEIEERVTSRKAVINGRSVTVYSLRKQTLK